MRILLVENDKRNATLMRRALRAAAFAVDTAPNADEAAYRLDVNDYDLVILDTVLPDRDGVELIGEIRDNGIEVPIIILTAKGSTEDRIAGLDAGADDFVVKPFEVLELMARIRAILRRPRHKFIASRMVVGDLEIDTGRRVVLVGGEELAFTNKEYALLEYLARNVDRVIGREELSEHVWDEAFDPFSNLIEVYINRVRKKLSSRVERPKLNTRRGSGYLLELSREDVIG